MCSLLWVILLEILRQCECIILLKTSTVFKDFSPIVLGSRTRSSKTEPVKTEKGTGILLLFMIYLKSSAPRRSCPCITTSSNTIQSRPSDRLIVFSCFKTPGAGCIKKWLKLIIVKWKCHPIRSAYLRVNHYLTTK
jgi:hypothetical protein